MQVQRSESTSALRRGSGTLIPTTGNLPGGRGAPLSKSLTIKSRSLSSGLTAAGGGGDGPLVRLSPPAEGAATALASSGRQPPARRSSVGSMLVKATGNRLEALVARPLPGLQARPPAAAAASRIEEDLSGFHRVTEVGTATAASRAAQNQRDVPRAPANVRDHAQAKSSAGGGNLVLRASTGSIPSEPAHSAGIVVATSSLGGGGEAGGGLAAVFPPPARASQPLLPSIVSRPPAQPPTQAPRPRQQTREPPHSEARISDASGDGGPSSGEDFLTATPHVGSAAGATRSLAASRSIIGDWAKSRSVAAQH